MNAANASVTTTRNNTSKEHIMNTIRTRRIAFASGIVAIAATVAFATPASAATDDLAGIEQSLVHVYTEYQGYILYPTADGDWVWSDLVTAGAMCTGWFASDEGHIATAGHCVEPGIGRRHILQTFLTEWDAMDLFGEAVAGWTVEGYETGSEIARAVEVVQPDAADDPIIDSWTTAQVIAFQDFADGDAALLKVAGIDGSTPLQVAQNTPGIGSEIVSIGFPGTVQDVVDVRRLGASFKTGTVSSHQVTDAGVPVTEVNAQVSGGMSGGPTVDADGNVIGINSFGILGEPQSFNFVTDTEALVDFFAAEGVDVEVGAAGGGLEARDVQPLPEADEPVVEPVAAEEPSDAGMGGLIAFGLIASAVLLLGGGIVTTIVLAASAAKRRAHQAPATPLAPTPAMWQQAPAPQQMAPAAQPSVPVGFAPPPAPPMA